MRRAAVWCLAAACAAAITVACKRPDERGEPAAPPDASLAPRPRPAEVAHLTLKVLGMT